MNLLALVNQVRSDSGTFPAALTTVAGVTGRDAKALGWVQMAWRSVQNAHKSWRWMQSEFTVDTVAATQRYAGTDCTDAFDLATITRFSEWDCIGLGEDRFKLFDPDIGLGDIGQIYFIPWERFYRDCVNTNASNDKPKRFSIDPANRLCLSPVPDDIYTVRGPYRKDLQELTADDDIPEMPTALHDVIASIAQQFLSLHDEAGQVLPVWKLRENNDFCRLEHKQLPQVRVGGPLA